MKPKTLILRAAGTNCDAETAHAFELAGASCSFVHVNQLLETPRLMSDFQMMALPGGFSYGDDIAAGRILASQITHHLRDAFQEFIDQGKPIIGICNGFQVLVKTELLPGPIAGRTGQTCTLTQNDSGRFVDRWVKLKTVSRKCIWTAGLDELELPIAHGEGKFVPADQEIRKALHQRDQVAFVYDGEKPDGTIDNPNGSVDAIAGICDSSGLILGLMPHPERYVSAFQHFAWTRRARASDEGAGLALFRNAVRHVGVGTAAGI
jgi:phosphoribosylformylglycinamidine synthase